MSEVSFGVPVKGAVPYRVVRFLSSREIIDACAVVVCKPDDLR